MSQVVKTYGRRNGGVAFPSSADVALRHHIFSSSSSTTACSSDGGGDSPPTPQTPPVVESKPKRQRKTTKKKHDAENYDGTGGVPKRQPPKKGVSRAAKRPLSKNVVGDSSLQRCPRRPLADRNVPVDTSQCISAEKPPRKLRCKNRRRTIKLSVPVACNVPDFNDIENYSLYIENDDANGGVTSSTRHQSASDCYALPVGDHRKPAAGGGRQLQAAAPLLSCGRRQILTRSSRHQGSSDSSVLMFNTSSYIGIASGQSVIIVSPRSSHSRGFGGGTRLIARMADAEKSLPENFRNSSHVHVRGSSSAVHRLAADSSPCNHLSLQPPGAGAGCNAISTPLADVDTRPPRLAMGDDADVSAIEDVELASESPLQMMTRSRLRHQSSVSLFTSPVGASRAVGDADSRRAAVGVGCSCRSASSRLEQQQCVCFRSQDVTTLSSGCSSTSSRNVMSGCSRSGSSRRAETVEGETSTSSMCLRSGKQYASVLSAIGITTADRLESIAEADFCEGAAISPAPTHQLGLSTQPSLLKSKSVCGYSADRSSLSVLFPVEQQPSDGSSHEKNDDEAFSEIWTVDLSGLPALDRVLRLCGQDDYVPFADVLVNCESSVQRKVGEGTFGEVFLLGEPNGSESVIKIVPIEGDFKVNDEPQKTFEEILPEIAISQKLSALRHASADPGSISACCTFIHLISVYCVQGAYPSELLAAWKSYDRARGSLNDCPDIFGCKQLYLLFEYDNGGSDLESYQFNHVDEGVSVLRQVVCGLAVAERTLHFEHRDLHWGNVLVKPVDDPDAAVSYLIDGEDITVPAMGVYARIIDFTLSRLEADGRTVYTDLSKEDTLFTGEGDYQFDIYRKMKQHNGNEWDKYEPFSNVLWVHYLADKITNAKTYPRDQKSKDGRRLLSTLRQFLKRCLQYSSALDILQRDPLFAFSS